MELFQLLYPPIPQKERKKKSMTLDILFMPNFKYIIYSHDVLYVYD